MLEMILAMREDGAIGKDNDLLYHIKQDLAYFKEKTMGKTCVMGRKTYESLPPKKLPNRKIIILTRDKEYKGLFEEEICTNLESIIELAKQEDIMVCGGKEIYDYFLKSADKVYLTYIHDKEADFMDENVVKMDKDKYLLDYKNREIVKYLEIKKGLTLTFYEIVGYKKGEN